MSIKNNLSEIEYENLITDSINNFDTSFDYLNEIIHQIKHLT